MSGQGRTGQEDGLEGRSRAVPVCTEEPGWSGFYRFDILEFGLDCLQERPAETAREREIERELVTL